ncbi:MAG: hypothetical protein JWQ98_3553 [Chlorobi bacterium]|nr:hypothetical protein [Chlorobiota bacterium]
MVKKSIDATSFHHIAGRDLLIESIPIGKTLFRVHRAIHAPLWFGPDMSAPVSGRFNAPNYEYGVCYLGTSFAAAFAETLLRNPTNRLLSMVDLVERSISAGHCTRGIRLARLHGAGLKRLSISAGTVHGSHPPCRRLALALHQHPQQIDGIAYRSYFDNDEICVALFDRAAGAITIGTTEGLMDDRRRLGNILDKYDVRLAP